jgi:pimeloyl-ACP methyl ester carboxylesterase
VKGVSHSLAGPVWTETHGGAVHALVAGVPDKGDVVVVPGLGVSVYLRQSVSLLGAAGFRAWLPDPPGFGDSGDPPHPLDVGEIAAVLVHWLRNRGLTKVTLIGHSCGTQIAARVAAAEPDLVRRLVLGSPTLDPRYRSWPKAVLRWLRDSRREPSSLAKTQQPEWLRAGPARLFRLTRSMLADDLEASLSRVTCPVVVVRAERDPISTPAWAQRLASGDDRRLVEIPGVAHAFPYQVPAVFADVLSGMEPS